jgi:hypothetical protein
MRHTIQPPLNKTNNRGERYKTESHNLTRVYVSLSERVGETKFMSMLLKEVVDNMVMPRINAEGNTSANYLFKNHQVGARAKLIDTLYMILSEERWKREVFWYNM